jgi:hypothetical protein
MLAATQHPALEATTSNLNLAAAASASQASGSHLGNTNNTISGNSSRPSTVGRSADALLLVSGSHPVRSVPGSRRWVYGSHNHFWVVVCCERRRGPGLGKGGAEGMAGVFPCQGGPKWPLMRALGPAGELYVDSYVGAIQSHLYPTTDEQPVSTTTSYGGFITPSSGTSVSLCRGLCRDDGIKRSRQRVVACSRTPTYAKLVPMILIVLLHCRLLPTSLITLGLASRLRAQGLIPPSTQLWAVANPNTETDASLAEQKVEPLCSDPACICSMKEDADSTCPVLNLPMLIQPACADPIFFDR